MKMVNTTLGAVFPDELGRVNTHEHVILRGEDVGKIFPDFVHDDVDLIGGEVSAWRETGGGALVDCSPIGAGRAAKECIAVSKRSKVPIILSTGFHKQMHYPAEHWVHRSSADDLRRIIHDEYMLGLTAGESTGADKERLPVKAGAIKAAIDESGLSPFTEKALRAALNVVEESGVPLILHTEPGCPYLHALEWILLNTTRPEKIVFCHMDKCRDAEILQSVLKSGVMVEFDSMVRPAFSVREFAFLMTELAGLGYGEQILFGGDLARHSYWKCYGGEPGLAYLITGLNNELSQSGVDLDLLDRIWVENPRRLFS